MPTVRQLAPHASAFAQVDVYAAVGSRFRFQPVRVRLPSAPPGLTSHNNRIEIHVLRPPLAASMVRGADLAKPAALLAAETRATFCLALLEGSA